MKITCTQEEKEWLVESLMTSEPLCIFADEDFNRCGGCHECLDEKIEWEIEDGEPGKTDPYKKLYEDLEKAFTKHSNMIAWLARKTLHTKDYLDFMDKFVKPRKDSESK